MKKHDALVNKLAREVAEYCESGEKGTLRFKHGSTNSSRTEPNEKYHYLDVSGLQRVLSVDQKNKTVLVEPNVSMDRLVDETLKYNLIPPVVMEFPAITVGGGIQGGALESSSFKYGQFNDICLEYEIITGTGEIIKASPSENADIFYGMSGSYGTLGVLTLIKIQLIEARDFVRLSYFPVSGFENTVNLLELKIKETHNYIEGVIFDENHSVIITGELSDKGHPVQKFCRAIDPWFHSHAKKNSFSLHNQVEYVPIKDYLFRYDRGSILDGRVWTKAI